MLITGVDLTQLIYLLITPYTDAVAYVSEDTRQLRFAYCNALFQVLTPLLVDFELILTCAGEKVIRRKYSSNCSVMFVNSQHGLI